MLGDFSNGEPTTAARDALVKLMAWKADRHDIDVLGRDPFTSSDGVVSIVPQPRPATATPAQTACPGDRLYPLLPGIRDRVAALVTAAQARPPATGRPPPTGGCCPSATRRPSVRWPARPCQRRHRRHGRHPDREGLLAARLRRRDLLLRRRQVLRLDRQHQAQQAGGRDGPDPDREGLLAGGHRRRDLLLRRRQVLRLDRQHQAQQAGRRHGVRHRPARATGWWPRDGGIFAFGDAVFSGSTGVDHAQQAGGVHGAQPEREGLLAGGLATAGSSPSTCPTSAAWPAAKPEKYAGAVQMRATTTGKGYYIADANGGDRHLRRRRLPRGRHRRSGPRRRPSTSSWGREPGRSPVRRRRRRSRPWPRARRSRGPAWPWWPSSAPGPSGRGLPRRHGRPRRPRLRPRPGDGPVRLARLRPRRAGATSRSSTTTTAARRWARVRDPDITVQLTKFDGVDVIVTQERGHLRTSARPGEEFKALRARKVGANLYRVDRRRATAPGGRAAGRS